MTRGLKWRGPQFQKEVDDDLVRRMGRTVIFLRDETVKGLSRTQSTARSGKSLIGLDPSKPGEFPKRVTGTLRRSIATQVEKVGRKIFGRYGTNVKDYPLALEFGTRRMSARPFLRPVFFGNKGTIRRILLG